MTDVFISYSHQDRDVARRYAEALSAEGLAVWWDDHLRSGEAFDEKIEAALRAAKAVVVLWSKTSVASRWVRAEAMLADRNKTLVPVMIEPCERPIMFELSHTSEMGHWTGDQADKAWLGFLGDVQRLANADAPSATPALTQPLGPASVKETLKPGQSGAAPSLAVLPFTNRSTLPEDDIFAEGMVEDVISALSQGVNVRVLGSTATANLSRAAITDLVSVGRQLGVRYLLEGNLRRVGANLRVTTQLLEAATGEVLWTAKFDRPLVELGELQEELVTEVAASLDTQVYAMEIERALKKPSDITAWEAVARAWSAYRKWDAAAQMSAIEEAKRAVAIAPDYAPGHAMLAFSLADAYLVRADDPVEVQRIRGAAECALSLAPDHVSVLGPVGLGLSYIGYPDEAARYTERAVRKAPGSGMLHFYHAGVCIKLNRLDEALSHLSIAERVSPGWHLMWAAKWLQSLAYCELGRWEEANAAIDESLTLLPSYAMGHVINALCCIRLGQDVEARRHIETACRLGCDPALPERLWRRQRPIGPRLEADIATVRALYAAAELGA